MATGIVNEIENLAYLFTNHDLTEILIPSLLKIFNC